MTRKSTGSPLYTERVISNETEIDRNVIIDVIRRNVIKQRRKCRYNFPNSKTSWWTKIKCRFTNPCLWHPASLLFVQVYYYYYYYYWYCYHYYYNCCCYYYYYYQCCCYYYYYYYCCCCCCCCCCYCFMGMLKMRCVKLQMLVQNRVRPERGGFARRQIREYRLVLWRDLASSREGVLKKYSYNNNNNNNNNNYI